MPTRDDSVDMGRIGREDRVATNLRADVRLAGTSRIPAIIINLSTTGFYLRCEERLRPGSRIWIRIGSPAPLMAPVIWRDAYCAGCAFDQPLHPAILNHLVSTAE
jgi:hypothetical protein